MNINYISRNVGLALVFNAAFMFLSVLVSLCYGMDGSFSPLLLSGVITIAVGAFPLVFVRKTGSITVKEGFFTIVFTPYLSLVRTIRRVADKMYTLFKMNSHKKVLFRCKQYKKVQFHNNLLSKSTLSEENFQYDTSAEKHHQTDPHRTIYLKSY